MRILKAGHVLRSAPQLQLSILVLVGILLGALACMPMRAEDLTLDRAIQIALERRPELRASDFTKRSAEAMRRQAGALPNPRAIYQSENLRPNMDFAGNVDTYAYVSQPIEISGKRHARISAAETAVSEAELNAEIQSRDIKYAVARAYWDALRLIYLRKLAEESQGFYHEILEYQERRFSEGKLAAIDLMRVRLEHARAQTRLESSRLAETEGYIRLAAEMGLPAPGAWSLQSKFESVGAASPEVLAEDASDHRLEVKLAGKRVEAARSNLLLQKAMGRPDLDAVFGYKRNSDNNTMLAGVQIPLPLLDRNRGGVQSAQSEIEAGRASLAGVQQRSRMEWSLARTAYATWKQQVETLYGPMVAQAKEIAEISRAAYGEGGMDLLRLLDAERLYVETQIAWAESLGNYHQSLLSLNYAAGMEP